MEITRESLKQFAESDEGVRCLKGPTGLCREPFPLALMKDAAQFVANPENKAAGLASTQIGDYGRWFVMKRSRDGTLLIVINPTVLGRMGSKQYIEGCFSEKFPARVRRAKSITVTYTPATLNENGDIVILSEQRETFEGLDAQVFQHEWDHLRGLLIGDQGEVIGND